MFLRFSVESCEFPNTGLVDSREITQTRQYVIITPRINEKQNTMKQKYDSSVIYLYATGNEGLLPKEFRKQIPNTTISTWRKTDYSVYIGNEFRYFFDEAFESAEIKYKYKQLKRTMIDLAKSWISLSDVIKPAFRKIKNNKQLKKNMLNALSYLERSIGREKGLKLLGISPTLYQQWQIEDYKKACKKKSKDHRSSFDLFQ